MTEEREREGYRGGRRDGYRGKGGEMDTDEKEEGRIQMIGKGLVTYEKEKDRIERRG